MTSPAIDKDTRSVDAPDAWFSAAVTGIFTALVDRAAAATNATRKYFATAEMDFDPKLYGLAQCAPDLTPAQCQGCLRNLQKLLTGQYLSRRPPSNAAFLEWCFLRYTVSRVYDGRAMLLLAAPPVSPPSATFTPSSSGQNRVPVRLFSSKRNNSFSRVTVTGHGNSQVSNTAIF